MTTYSAVLPARPLRQALSSGGLVWTLIRTDFKTRYHGTVGGFIWALLKPFTMFLVLLGVFSFIFASEPAYKLYLILGLFLWGYFAEGTTTGIIALHVKGFLLNKARFPTWIVVVTAASNALITLLIFMGVILAFVALTRGVPGPVELLLLSTYLVSLVLIVAGISLGGSVLFLRYRDLNQLWEVMIQAGFFVAPVVYPLKIIPERFHFYLYLWPPTSIIQFSRAVVIDHSVPTLKAHLLLALMTAAILGVGIATYRRLAPRAAECL